MRSTSTKSTLGLLSLLSLKGIGPATAQRFGEKFATLDEISDASAGDLRGIVRDEIAVRLRDRYVIQDAVSDAEETLQRCADQGIGVFSVYDTHYPRRLLELPDRPAVLFYKGNLRALEKSVAVIGTREPSEFGARATKGISAALVDAGWVIVSGLALGVDSIAHTVAVEKKGRTVAVLANGLDKVYPTANAQLADEILSNDGVLLSEQTLGMPATPRNLVARDRLQSGLSVATFVMQTDIRGGSMHTVRYTLMQRRRLFAPLPSGRHADEPKSQGILALTQKTGEAFADLVGAEAEYRRLLTHTFKARTLATPIKRSEDYPLILEQLELELCSPVDDHLAARRAVQTELF